MSTEQLKQVTTTARRYGRMDALCTYLGMSAATGWRRVQDDPAFPRPIKVSDGVTLFDFREADLYVATKRAASVAKDAKPHRGSAANPPSMGGQAMHSEITMARAQARCQLKWLNRTYDDLWPHRPRNEGGDLGILEAFTLRHPMTAATKEQAAIHEAGHSVAYESLGMMMNAAAITGPPFGRGGWGGTAQYCELFYGPWRGEWYPDAMRRGAIATLAGPIAEELIGRGEALSSLGEVVAAIVLVRRAAELEGRKPSEILHEVFLGTTGLVTRHEPEIRDIGELLMKRGRIGRSQPSVRKILSRVPRAAIDTEPLSVSGQTLFDKLMGAFEELRLLASSARAAARGELSEAGL